MSSRYLGILHIVALNIINSTHFLCNGENVVHMNAKNQRKVRFYLPCLSCTFDLLVKINETERWKIETNLVVSYKSTSAPIL